MQVKQLMEAGVQYGSKDFYEIQAQFEKDYKKLWSFAYGHKLDRVSRETRDAINSKLPRTQFYDDEIVNQWFQVYMAGYTLGTTM
jgi:hypothetical protein